MELESKRLKLQEITWDDVDILHKLYSHPEVDEYNTQGIPHNIDATKEMIRPMIESQQAENRTSYAWKIVRKDTGELIGVAGIFFAVNRFKLGEIFYELFPSHWGHGYATEVAKTLINAGFDHFHLHKVEAGVATENVRSIRVLENTGMTREGLRRKILPIRGEWKDNYHYAIVEDDPRDFMHYNSDFCSVNYLPDLNAAFVTWKQFCYDDDYRNPLRYAIKIMKTHDNCSYIADTRTGFKNRLEDTTWIFNTFIPEAKAAGCKHIFFIINPDNSLKEELEGQSEELRKSFKVHACFDLDEVKHILQ